MNRYRLRYVHKLIREAHQDEFSFVITSEVCTCCLRAGVPVAQIGKRKPKGFICADCLNSMTGGFIEHEVVRSILS